MKLRRLNYLLNWRQKGLKYLYAVGLFLKQAFHPLLHTHPLQGKYDGYWSINVGGDLRALYKYETSDSIVFSRIGTHHELFGS